MKFDVTPVNDAWAARTPRERVMLAGLAVLVALVVGWYGVYDPLRRAAEDAKADRRVAVTRLAVVEAAAAEVRRAAQAGTSASPAVLEQLVLDSAAQAGVSIEPPRQDGATTVVRALAASPAPLFAWIQGLQMRQVTVRGFSATRGAGGTVDAEVRLARR